jgi:hypothetical protein
MEMVGHQDIGVDPTVELVRGGADLFPQEPVVVLLEEDLLAIVAALNHMLRDSGQNEAG